MAHDRPATAPAAPDRRREDLGLLLGLGGVLAFSLTPPVTRRVVTEMSPVMVAPRRCC